MSLKSLALLAGLYCILTACHSRPRSGIEKIFVDSGIVKELESRHNAVLTGPLDSGLKRTYYFTKTGSINGIVRDSLNRIRAIDFINANNDSLTFNYYPNGQSEYKRILRVKPGLDSGVIFYPDGRIFATGLGHGRHNIGEWKYYDSAGYLALIRQYTDNGEITSEKFIR